MAGGFFLLFFIPADAPLSPGEGSLSDLFFESRGLSSGRTLNVPVWQPCAPNGNFVFIVVATCGGKERKKTTWGGGGGARSALPWEMGFFFVEENTDKWRDFRHSKHS